LPTGAVWACAVPAKNILPAATKVIGRMPPPYSSLIVILAAVSVRVNSVTIRLDDK
jgi:hypothetical protein